MQRIKVLTVAGTRPELIKLACVLDELDRHTDHVLVHTGQNFDHELNSDLIEELGLRPPRHRLDVAAPTPAASIAKVIAGIDPVLEQESPDALLVYGDTNSCLAALAAKRRRIPVFHMEAGNRCFDERVPEEINRRIIDHLADINMAITEHGRRHLLAEGLRPQTIFVTGSPMGEVLARYRDRIQASDVHKRLDLEPHSYLLVSAHREENVDDPHRLQAIVEILEALCRQYDRRIVVSTHPRTRRRLEALPSARWRHLGRVQFARPFGFCDWIRLQRDAFCVVSDSGTLTEEATLLGFPAVMLRESHERPEGMDAGVTVMCGLSAERALQAVTLVGSDRPTAPSNLGSPPMVSRQVVRIITSYIDYIRRTVWQEAGEPRPHLPAARAEGGEHE